MTSSATDVSETPRFKSASMSVIQGQAPSLSGVYVHTYLIFRVRLYSIISNLSKWVTVSTSSWNDANYLFLSCLQKTR